MKLGWIQVSGVEKLVAEATNRLELIADTYLSVATGIQQATPHFLNARQTIQQQILERVQSNENFLHAQGFATLRREGGWYAIMETAQEAEALALELLQKHNVLIHPGYFYDFKGRQVLVLSLLTHPQVFAAGIMDLSAAGARALAATP
jgi:aspartate/methionine/tyrosine aminotransferase